MGSGSSIQYFIGTWGGATCFLQPGLTAPNGRTYVQTLLENNGGLKEKLSGRAAVVTGVSVGGSGYHIAEALANDVGMMVFLVGRSEAKIAKAADSIKADASDRSLPEPALITIASYDLYDLKSVKATANEIQRTLDSKTNGALHILVNNAGALVPQFDKTVQGVEANVGTNYLATHYLTDLLLPNLRLASRIPGTPKGRIAHVSSIYHAFAWPMEVKMLEEHPEGGGVPESVCKRNDEGGYVGQELLTSTRMYGQSKMMMLSDARALAKQEPDLRVLSLHPGSVATQFGKALGIIGKIYYNGLYPLQYTPQQGACTPLRAALDPIFEGKDSPGGRGAYLHCTGNEWTPASVGGFGKDGDLYDTASDMCKKLTS